MAMITTPIPDVNGAKSVDQKIEMLLDNYFMLRKEIEYGMQNIDFENISSEDITKEDPKSISNEDIESPKTLDCNDSKCDDVEFFEISLAPAAGWTLCPRNELGRVPGDSGLFPAPGV